MLVRHHCAVCDSRIFPFDKYEHRTEVPAGRGKEHYILLASANQRDPNKRAAWCWNCKEFVEARRITEDEILQMYLSRKGVITRSKVVKRK